MKRVITLLSFLLISAYSFAGGGVTFIKGMSWAAIKAKAAREKKMIFFDAYTSWCGPCKYLEESVYTDASVGSYYNANFINVKFDMEAGEGIKLSEEFDITSYPTLLFFSPDGKLLHKSIGAMESAEFLQLGKAAKDPSKQYYTLKQRVTDKKATASDFVAWTKMADDLEDQNRGALANSWLSVQQDILGSADLAKATLLYADVNETQLSYLMKNRKKIAELLSWEASKVDQTLYEKLYNLAVRGFDYDKKNKDAFIATIKKFDAAKLNYAICDLDMTIALKADKDASKAIVILRNSIRGINRISLEEMCSLLIDNSPSFDEHEMGLLKESLDAYKFTDADKGQECWFYLAQVIMYSKLTEFDKAKEVALKAYQSENLPESYKSILKESYGIK